MPCARDKHAATYLTFIKLTNLPQKAVSCPQSADEKTHTCTLRQAQHSVHTHTYPPVMLHVSTSRTSPPTPQLLSPSSPSLPRALGPPQFPGRDSTAQGHEGFPSTLSRRRAPASPTIQQVLQVLRAVLLGAGAVQGVRMQTGSSLEKWRDAATKAGRQTSQELRATHQPAPQRAVPEGRSGESLPQTPSLPIHSQLSVPDFSILQVHAFTRARHPHRETVLQESVLPLFVALPSA